MSESASTGIGPDSYTSGIPKAYEPQAVEEKWYAFWEREGCFTANPESPKPAYSIVIPPPNVTGVLHMGHVLNNTIQDILARKARMDGKEVLWLPGTDHAGIATQAVVEKALRKEGKMKHREDLGREKFLEHVWAWKEKHGGIIIQQLKKLGCSCDWSRERFTMDPEYSRCVQKVFVELYKKGLIYRGKRMVNWDPAARTALSDEEVEMTEVKGHLWHLKYPMLDDAGRPIPDQFVMVATTRPETMLGDEAVAVNPNDERYTKLVGRKVLLPLQNKPIPIIADDFVDPKFGTGCVKVTPAHDPNDYAMATRHNLPLTVVIGPDGKMTNEAGGGFAGLGRTEARKAVVEHLEKLGLLLKVEDYVHNVGFSQRSHVPIEPYLSEQWFLKYPSVEKALECVANSRSVRVVTLRGDELHGANRGELRHAALKLARERGWLGRSFPNQDTGWQIHVRRRSLSHAFSSRNSAAIQAVAALPELIHSAVLIRSEPHNPPAPDFKAVHHFMAALRIRTEDFAIPITVKELSNGQYLYDHKAKKITPGGKPLGPHPLAEKLDFQPAPGARRKLADLLSLVNGQPAAEMAFHPDRWAKTYSHWMTNLRDWCISRQLWWGHRVPVWYHRRWREVEQREVTLIREPWETIPGRTVKELRDNAWLYARSHGLLNSDFPNLDTGFDITVQQSSLEHAFSNRGVANIKLVPALPRLLRHAIRVATVPHDPPAREIVCVHVFYAALLLGHTLFRVKFTVKEFRNRLRLYDHQSVVVQKMETDGKCPPEEAPVAGSFAPWPASVSAIKLIQLCGGVKPDFAAPRCQIESPGEDWEQDPDVLDTWFSSWLWPFATMGWPEPTPTLKKFYPTTDLVTGPDIIFFWVARMIMAGYEFMGDLPFRHVYFTGIIRDKLGRKMSKSLGNSPDPLELIAKYGADALRFGTMRSAPLGQDVLFDEKDVELGRNFCNKLWNACRFRQMQGGEVQGEINPALLTSDDKWILLRLDRAIREIHAAYAEYHFNEIAQTLYRFFWSEYCDWYVEAAKAPLQSASPAQKANTLAVMDFVLSHTLRLFHPYLPFITEELWHGMGYSADMPEAQGGKTILFAPWPKPLSDAEKEAWGLDDAADQLAAAKYDLVGLGRNWRREYNLPASKRLNFVLKPAGMLAAPEVEVLRLLLNAEQIQVDPGYNPPQGTPRVANALGELYLPLTGLIDFAAERARLTKELEKARAEVAKVREKLDNPQFTQKVPAKVLEEHQKRLADWQAKVNQVEQSLANLPA